MGWLGFALPVMVFSSGVFVSCSMSPSMMPCRPFARVAQICVASFCLVFSFGVCVPVRVRSVWSLVSSCRSGIWWGCPLVVVAWRMVCVLFWGVWCGWGCRGWGWFSVVCCGGLWRVFCGGTLPSVLVSAESSLETFLGASMGVLVVVGGSPTCWLAYWMDCSRFAPWVMASIRLRFQVSSCCGVSP